MLKKILFVVSSLALARAQIPSLGFCPEYVPMANFDMSKFLGVWYEAERYFQITEVISRCVTANYTKGPDGKLRVSNEVTNRLTGIKRVLEGEIKAPASKAEEGKLHVKYTVPFTPATQYAVLDTDYKNYAVLWSCSGIGPINAQNAWLMTRTRQPAGDVLQKAYGVLDKYKISKTFFVKTDQQDCAYLDNNPVTAKPVESTAKPEVEKPTEEETVEEAQQAKNVVNFRSAIVPDAPAIIIETRKAEIAAAAAAVAAAEKPAVEAEVAAEEPAVEPAVAAEEPAVAVPEIAAADEPAAALPAVAAEEPAVEPAVVAEEPAVEPAVAAEEPAKEPAVAAEEPAAELEVAAEVPALKSVLAAEPEADEEPEVLPEASPVESQPEIQNIEPVVAAEENKEQSNVAEKAVEAEISKPTSVPEVILKTADLAKGQVKEPATDTKQFQPFQAIQEFFANPAAQFQENVVKPVGQLQEALAKPAAQIQEAISRPFAQIQQTFAAPLQNIQQALNRPTASSPDVVAEAPAKVEEAVEKLTETVKETLNVPETKAAIEPQPEELPEKINEEIKTEIKEEIKQEIKEAAPNKKEEKENEKKIES